MKRVIWLAILTVLVTAPSWLMAQEGQGEYNHATVGIFADYFRFDPSSASKAINFVGFGARTGFHVSRYTQIEAEMNYLQIAIDKTADALRVAVAGRAAVRAQHSVHAGARSVPEPDIAVVPGRHDDYARARPRTALLVVEVSDSSLARDRLRKAPVYAAAGIPEYWIVNLRDDVVEVSRAPERGARRYTETRVARRGERLELVALPGTSLAVDDLLPEV